MLLVLLLVTVMSVMFPEFADVVPLAAAAAENDDVVEDTFDIVGKMVMLLLTPQAPLEQEPYWHSPKNYYYNHYKLL